MIKVLTLEDTKKILNMGEVIETVETAYREKAEGTAVVFPLVTHDFEPGKADMDIKSGDIKGLNAFGLKLVSWFGDNPAKGLPALVGVVMVFDDRTGMPLGLINAGHMTGMRTGAAGAIGIKYLSRTDSETLLMVGAGGQAAYQIRAALTVRPGLKRVLVHDPVNPTLAEELAKNMKTVLQEAASLGERYPQVSFEAAPDLEAAVGQSQIIVTATPSRKAMIRREWVQPGTHFSCMGSDMSGKQEIDEAIIPQAVLVVDDLTQCLNVGEMETAYKKGMITENDIRGEIGQIICGEKPGRADDTEITVYDSTGLSLQDISVGAQAFRKADELGIGSELEF